MEGYASREEYYQAYPKADADGWIEWNGGECPVDNDSLVDVKFPDGSEYFNTDAYGDWSSESDTPISHYRQSKKVVKPEFCESVMRSIPEPEAKHDAKASELPVLSNGKREPVIEWVEVTKEPTYMVYKPSGKEHRTLRVIYKLAGTQAFCEYICLEHPRDSYACKKAREWWRKRSDIQPPETCWEAYHLLKNCPQALASPARMLLKWLPGKKWPEIMEVELGPKEPIDPMALEEAQAIAGISSTLFKK